MYAKADKTKVGDDLIADGGFTCMREGTVHTVKRDSAATGYYVMCHHGKHYLSGQENEDGDLVGFTKAK